MVRKVGIDKGTYYHKEILNAIRDRDSSKAKKLMAEHLEAANSIFFDSADNT